MKKVFQKAAAICLTLCLTGSYAFAAEKAAFSDLAEDTFLSKSVEALSGYGILEGYPDGTFRPEEAITRAEMAAAIIRMRKMESTAESVSTGNSKYTDLTPQHWANGYIILASDLEILQGNGDGTFLPDQTVTYEQAVKMLVCALGYGKVFNKIPDAYPISYLVQANELGLTRNAGGKTSDPITRGTAAKLAYNTLSAPLLKRTVIGGPEGDVFASMNGENGNPLETIETVMLDNCKFYLLGEYNHVMMTLKDFQTAETEAVTGSTNIRLKCTEAGAKKLKQISEELLKAENNQGLKAFFNGEGIGDITIEEVVADGEIVLKGGFSETKAEELVQAINDEIL